MPFRSSRRHTSTCGRKIIGVRFGQPITDDFNLPHATLLKRGQWGAKIELDTTVRPVDDLIAALMAYAPVVDLTVEDPPMEEIIREIYKVEDSIALTDIEKPAAVEGSS